MDAVVIVDPVQYQRRPGERDDVSMPLRSLHFGPDGAGLVTFLVYPPALAPRSTAAAPRGRTSLAIAVRPAGSAEVVGAQGWVPLTL